MLEWSARKDNSREFKTEEGGPALPVQDPPLVDEVPAAQAMETRAGTTDCVRGRVR